ncbi:MAG: hypothetical protein AVDCRST_MAG13-1296, partial [uncultured Solirubrobacteraceae bacterium]
PATEWRRISSERTASRRSEQKSRSMSGGSSRPTWRNLSKRSRWANGSGVVSPRQRATRELAALPRPVTGVPSERATSTASRAIRK